jgi:hypothetical protein
MSASSEAAGGGGNRKRIVIAVVVVAVLAVVVLVVVLIAGRTSPRGWIPDNYQRVAADTYRSQQPPRATADRIFAKFDTDDRLDQPNGSFLRYHDVFVAILPEGSGSRITLDDRDRGYNRYRSYVGHVWTSSGRVESFRGGGPGDGK